VATAVAGTAPLTPPRVELAVEDRAPRFAWSALVFGIAFATLAIVRFGSFGSDTFMTLVGGREIADHGLPSVERLTSEGLARPWVDQQWLAQLTFYRTWEGLGGAGAALVAALLTAAAFAILAAILLERGASPRRAVKWSLLAFAVALPNTAVRAQAFAYLLFIALVWLILRDAEGRGGWFSLAAAVPLLVLWANLHGSVVLGVLLLAAYCAWKCVRLLKTHRRSSGLYAAVGIAAIVSPLATPYGSDTLSYYQAVLGNDAIRGFASEWQPAKPLSLPALGFYVFVVAVAVVVLQAWRRDVRPEPALAVATFGVCLAGFYAMRWETWAALLGTILAADLLNAQGRPSSSPHNLRRPAVAAAALVLASVIALAAHPFEGVNTVTPLGAMTAANRFALEHPGALILADDASADALLWHHPSLAGRVAFDARLEIFREEDVRRWGDFIRGRPDAAFLDRYDVLLAADANSDLRQRLKTLRGWRVLYEDGAGIAVVRGA
jgi:hypothetical protein